MIRYLVAALRAPIQKPEWTMSLEWDDGTYEGPASLISVGNWPIIGGIFRMAPGADPTDGLLIFVVGHASTHRRMISLLPKVIRGTNIYNSAVKQYQACHFAIRSDPAILLQVEGGLRGTDSTESQHEAILAQFDVLDP